MFYGHIKYYRNREIDKQNYLSQENKPGNHKLLDLLLVKICMGESQPQDDNRRGKDRPKEMPNISAEELQRKSLRQKTKK